MDHLMIGAHTLGLKLTPEHRRKFEIYYRELLDWNSRFNLTAIRDETGIFTLHFLDSLTCLLGFDVPATEGVIDASGVAGRVIDVGSGAGFPGVPLSIVCPGLKLTLLESVRKKASFLQHLVGVLELPNVEVIVARAEDYARKSEARDGYDFAVARALSPLPTLLEYCLPFVRVGGRLVAPKKGDLQAEIAAARPAVAALGGTWHPPIAVPPEVLPGERLLIVIDKATPTPRLYPRRAGVPAKQPIGHQGSG